MAQGKVKKTDIAESDIFGDINKSAKDAEKSVKMLVSSLNMTVQTAKAIQGKINTVNPKDVKSIAELNKLTAMSNKNAANKLKIDKQLAKEKIKLSELQKEQNKLLRQEVKLERAAVGSINQLTAANKKLREERNRLNLDTERGQKRLKQINQQIDLNTAKIERNNDAISRQKTGIGRYQNALQGLNRTLGRLGVAFGAFSIARDSLNIIKNFDQAVGNLRAISGFAADDIEMLTAKAKELGSTTKFTASEVAGLQTELAKLGFDAQEIDAASESILNLAAATGAELPRAAEVAGSTIRSFGLDATETGRVVDVMTKSFSSSALDIERFQESIKLVAPIARATGRSIEETTAFLGVLADNGITGSIAGTQLNRVFVELNKQGLSLSDAIDQVSQSQNGLAEATDLVGDRGAKALLILSENTSQTAELNNELENAGGTAEKVANEQLDTLSGALALLRSAWEGFILELNDGVGALGFLKDLVLFVAQNLSTLIGVAVKAATIWGLYVAQAKLTSFWNNRIVESSKGLKRSLLGLSGLVRKLSVNFKLFNRNLKQSASAYKEAGGGVKGFGAGIKNLTKSFSGLGKGLNAGKLAVKGFGLAFKALPLIGWASAIYDIASALIGTKDAAKEAAKQVERLNAARKEGAELSKQQTKLSNERIEQSNKEIDQQIRLIKATKDLTEEEKLKRINDLQEGRLIVQRRILNGEKINARETIKGTTEIISSINAVEQRRKELQDRIDNENLSGQSLSFLREQVKAQEEILSGLRDELTEVTGQQDFGIFKPSALEAVKFAEGFIEQSNKRLKETKEILEELGIQEKELKANQNGLNGDESDSSDFTEQRKIVKGTIEDYQKQIQAQRKFQTQQATTNKQFKDSEEIIKELQKEIDRLQGSQKDVNTEFKTKIELNKELNKELEKQAKIERDIKNITTESVLSSLDTQIENEFLKQSTSAEETGQFDLTNLNSLIEQRKKIEIDAIIDVRDEEIKAIDEANKKRFESIRERLMKEKESLLEGAKGNDEAQKTINENFKSKLKEVEALEKEANETTAKERVKIREEANAEIIEVENKFNDEIKKVSEEVGAGSESFESQRIEQSAEIRNQVISTFTDQFIKNADKRIQKIDEEINKNSELINSLRQAANEGNISAKESLAEQEALQREALAKRERLEKRKQNIQTVSNVLTAFNTELENPENETSGEALTKALTSQAVLTQFISALPTFLDGIENTGAQGQGLDGKGGFLSVLHPYERVVDKENNDKIGNMTNNDLADLAYSYQIGALITPSELKTKDSSAVTIAAFSKLNQSVKELQRAVENKPTTNIELGEITQSAMEIVSRTTKNNTITTNRFKVKN